VPLESVEESPQFFDQILIKNIIHIDHKINELKKLSSHSNYDVRQLSLSVAEYNKSVQDILPECQSIPKILEHAMGEIKTTLRKHQDVTLHLQDKKDKDKVDSGKTDSIILAELQQLRKELFSLLDKGDTSITRTITEKLDRLHLDSDNSSVTQDVHNDNIMAVLEKTEQIESNIQNKFAQLTTRLNTVDQNISSLSTLVCEKFEQLHESIQMLQIDRRGSISPTSIPTASRPQSTNTREGGRDNRSPNDASFNRQAPPHMPQNEQPRQDNSTDKIEVPRIKDWPKFTGEGEYDHLEFVRTIDLLKEDFELCDLGISGRLSSLFKGNARRWFNNVRLANGRKPWSWWKQQIVNKWGSPAWRYKLENKFDESVFDVEKDSPVKWFLTQKDRLQASGPTCQYRIYILEY